LLYLLLSSTDMGCLVIDVFIEYFYRVVTRMIKGAGAVLGPSQIRQ